MNAQMTNAKLLFAAIAILLLGAVSCTSINCPAYSHQPAAKSLDRKVWGSDEAPREVRNKTAHYRYKGKSQLAEFFTRR